MEAHRFDGKSGSAFVILPRGGDFEVVSAAKGAGSLSPWCLAKLAEAFPKAPTGWRKASPGRPRSAGFSPSTGLAITGRRRMSPNRARACWSRAKRRGSRRLCGSLKRPHSYATSSTRPAADLGPAELEEAARELASNSGVQLRVTSGDDLAKGYPLIAAVGGAASRRPLAAPHRTRMGQGRTHPRVAIIGKGVCFDSGGLDLKPAERHAPHEEGHGRRGARPRPRPADHGRAAADPAASADPGGRKCRIRRTPIGPATSSSRARGCSSRSTTPTPKGAWSLPTRWPGRSRTSPS